MRLNCRECAAPLTENIRLLVDEDVLSDEPGKPFVPNGFYYVSIGEFPPDKPGDLVINLEDLLTRKHTDISERMDGCCGPTGLDGYNLLCPEGHEIGSEQSDCWIPHCAVLARELVDDA